MSMGEHRDDCAALFRGATYCDCGPKPTELRLADGYYWVKLRASKADPFIARWVQEQDAGDGLFVYNGGGYAPNAVVVLSDRLRPPMERG